MLELCLVLLFLIGIGSGYALYHLLYILPHVGPMGIKIPFINKVWKIEYIGTSQYPVWYDNDLYLRGKRDGVTEGFRQGVASKGDITVNQLVLKALADDNHELANQLVQALTKYDPEYVEPSSEASVED